MEIRVENGPCLTGKNKSTLMTFFFISEVVHKRILFISFCVGFYSEIFFNKIIGMH